MIIIIIRQLMIAVLQKNFMEHRVTVYFPWIIYIVIHSQICFAPLELFGVTRFPKLGSKPCWLRRQSKILVLGHEETSTSEGNFKRWCITIDFLFYICLLNGYQEEPCITLMATYLLHSLESSILQGCIIYIYIYIYGEGLNDWITHLSTNQ